MARPKYRPTEQHRKLARAFGMIGFPCMHIATAIGISPSTLEKYYAKDLVPGRCEGILKVARVALEMARSGKYPAMTRFWIETIGDSLNNPSYAMRKGPIGKTTVISSEMPTDDVPFKRNKEGKYVQVHVWPDQRRFDENGKRIVRRKPQVVLPAEGGEDGESAA